MSRVLQDLFRYNYVIGSTPSYYVAFYTYIDADIDLTRIDLDYQANQRPVTFLSLNDAIKEKAWPDLNRRLSRFFRRRFPVPSPWEDKEEPHNP